MSGLYCPINDSFFHYLLFSPANWSSFCPICELRYTLSSLVDNLSKGPITKNVENVSLLLSTYQSKIINWYENTQTVTNIINYVLIKI